MRYLLLQLNLMTNGICRRGISSFYNGKSKSFTSVTNAGCWMKSIVKPESPYSRKRRNVLAHTLLGDHNKTSKMCHVIRAHGGGISKKPTMFASSSPKSNSFALAFAIANPSSKTNHHSLGLKSRGPGSRWLICNNAGLL